MFSAGNVSAAVVAGPKDARKLLHCQALRRVCSTDVSAPVAGWTSLSRCHSYSPTDAPAPGLTDSRRCNEAASAVTVRPPRWGVGAIGRSTAACSSIGQTPITGTAMWMTGRLAGSARALPPRVSGLAATNMNGEGAGPIIVHDCELLTSHRLCGRTDAPLPANAPPAPGSASEILGRQSRPFYATF